ncbi:MAG: hypothetical protein ACOYN0_07635, partial [Phycisphaerales bacterium]
MVLARLQWVFWPRRTVRGRAGGFVPRDVGAPTLAAGIMLGVMGALPVLPLAGACGWRSDRASSWAPSGATLSEPDSFITPSGRSSGLIG